MRYLKAIIMLILSATTALILSIVSNGADGLENARFKIGLYDVKAETGAIGESIKNYVKDSAALYNSGGFVDILEEMPAAPIIKRRIMKDVNMLKGDGLIMIFDKDDVDITDIEIQNRMFVEARTHEVWAAALQDAKTRVPVFNVKAITVNARYLLYKGSLRGEEEQWIVYHVDVYPENEDIPDLNVRPVL